MMVINDFSSSIFFSEKKATVQSRFCGLACDKSHNTNAHVRESTPSFSFTPHTESIINSKTLFYLLSLISTGKCREKPIVRPWMPIMRRRPLSPPSSNFSRTGGRKSERTEPTKLPTRRGRGDDLVNDDVAALFVAFVASAKALGIQPPVFRHRQGAGCRA